MPQYYKILDNGQKPVKEKAMPRKNQNINRQGGKKVNYRMREGSNYYGEVSGVKKKSTARTSGVAADRAKAPARTSGRTADSRGKVTAAPKKKNPYIDDTSRKMRGAPNKNYVKGARR